MAGSRASKAILLSDNEGSVLGLVMRRQPVTTYQLMRIFAESPVSSLNESKGTIYPVVRRLKARKLLSARAIEGDARNTELLHCTAEGRRALREWIMTIAPGHILPEDPLRTKLLSFEQLSAAERRQWVQNATALVVEKMEQVECFGVSLRMPYQTIILDYLMEGLGARKAWLDKIGEAIERQERSVPASDDPG